MRSPVVVEVEIVAYASLQSAQYHTSTYPGTFPYQYMRPQRRKRGLSRLLNQVIQHNHGQILESPEDFIVRAKEPTLCVQDLRGVKRLRRLQSHPGW